MNADGLLDAGDSLLSTQTLNVGESFPILVKLFAPAIAPMGTQNTQTLLVSGNQDDGDSNPSTCTGAALNDQVQDVTTVSLSTVSIMKEQAVDVLCDGIADGAGFSKTSFQVDPGACVIYRLTAKNTGAAPALNARIDDASPTYTQFFGTPTVTQGNINGGVAGTEGSITGGSISGASVTLLSGQSLVMTFSVKLE